MKNCKLSAVFPQSYHCKNNRMTKRKPQNKVRQNEQLQWHSNPKNLLKKRALLFLQKLLFFLNPFAFVFM